MNIINILDAISPTPALSGYPKKESLKIIAELENYDRGWYSGAIGWIDSEIDCDFFAGLRSVFIKENKFYIYGGAGIVENSNSEELINEIEEIFELVNYKDLMSPFVNKIISSLDKILPLTITNSRASNNPKNANIDDIRFIVEKSIDRITNY